MTQTIECEERKIEHLTRIIKNLEMYWHSIENLLNVVSKPLLLDDEKFRRVANVLIEEVSGMIAELRQMNITQYIAEVKYIGNRLNNIEKILQEIKNSGVKKDVRIGLTVDGYELQTIMGEEVNIRKRMKDDSKQQALQEISNKERDALARLYETLKLEEQTYLDHHCGLRGNAKKTDAETARILEWPRNKCYLFSRRLARKLRIPPRIKLIPDTNCPEIFEMVYGTAYPDFK
jgi:hypothetical protein